MKIEIEEQFNDRKVYKRRMSDRTKMAIWCFIFGFITAFIFCMFFLVN